MARSAALLILSARERTGAETDTVEMMAQFPGPGQEGIPLAEGVARALRATGFGPLRNIEVTAHGRLVVLAGRVPTYYLKQVAQSAALAVPGTLQVRNDLDVGRPS